MSLSSYNWQKQVYSKKIRNQNKKYKTYMNSRFMTKSKRKRT